MFYKLLVFSLIGILFQIGFLPCTHGQVDNELIEQEFYLLCRDVRLKLLTDQNARRILGDTREDLPLRSEDPLDVDLSFTWWESSLIFRENQRRLAGGRRTLWDEENAEWGMTYGQKYEEITVPPKIDNIPQFEPVNIYKSVAKEPQDNIPPIEGGGISTTRPDLTWSPEVMLKTVSPDATELSNFGKWDYKQREPWRRDALMSIVAGAIGLAGYVLSRHSEDIEYFITWPPQAPECWTACAKGDPIWHKPSLPNADVEMTPAEWRQNKKLQEWYVTPPIDTRTPKSAYVYDYGRDIFFVTSIAYAVRALWKYSHKQSTFPE